MRRMILLALGCALPTTIGCGDDETNPTASYANDYTPSYTDVAGKSYSGDFYPMEAGLRWDYGGTISMMTSLRVTGSFAGGRIDETENTPVEGQATGSLELQAPVEIRVPSGTYEVYPERFTSFDPTSYDILTRYLERAGDTVYVRAIEGEDGQVIEVEDPVFMKTPLVVGDKWEASPRVDIDALTAGLGEAGEMSISVNSLMHVVGVERIEIGGQMVEAVRVDQVADIEGSILIEGSNMDLSMTMLVVYYFKAGIGMVAQNMEEMSLEVAGSFAQGGERLTIEMTMSGSSDLVVTDYPSAFPPLAKRSAIAPGAVTSCRQAATTALRLVRRVLY